MCGRPGTSLLLPELHYFNRTPSEPNPLTACRMHNVCSGLHLLRRRPHHRADFSDITTRVMGGKFLPFCSIIDCVRSPACSCRPSPRNCVAPPQLRPAFFFRGASAARAAAGFFAPVPCRNCDARRAAHLLPRRRRRRRRKPRARARLDFGHGLDKTR